MARAVDHQSAAERHAKRAQCSLLQPGEKKKQPIEGMTWNVRERRFLGKKFFAKSDGPFRGNGPLIPVLRIGDRESGLLQQRKKCSAAVARAMVIHDVVIGPQHAKSGHSEKQSSAGFQQGVSAGQGASRIFKVLENVEHEQQVVAFGGLKAGVKRNDVNFGGVRAQRINEMGVWFDAFDIAELHEARKEQGIAATDVQNMQR